jgi:arsenite-transporting ATPase
MPPDSTTTSLATELLRRPVLFVGGKGGVGKTTIASAVALRSADRGDRTLLVSTDAAHSTGDILDQPLSGEPQQVVDNLWAAEIDPEREADAYIADVKARVADTAPPRLAGEVERQIDIARVSPGAEEAALFDRFTRILDGESEHYDRIVFDTAPTGHTLRLLSLPETMTAWITGLIAHRQKVNILGRMWRNVAGSGAGSHSEREDPVLQVLDERKQRFERARTLVSDPQRTAFAFVVIPERLPILETAKAVGALDKYRIPVGGVFVNRVLPGDAEGAFLHRRRERERKYLDEIAAKFADHPIRHVPLLDADVVGVPALRALGERL